MKTCWAVRVESNGLCGSLGFSMKSTVAEIAAELLRKLNTRILAVCRVQGGIFYSSCAALLPYKTIE